MKIPNKHKAQTGQALVEFALTVPILLFVILGIIDLARLLYGFNQVVNASRHAVRYGIVDGLETGNHQYLDCAGIRHAATSMPGLIGLDDDDITITYENSKGDTVLGECTTVGPSVWTVNQGEVLAVNVAGSFRPITPILAMFDDDISFDYTSRRAIQAEGAPYTSTWPKPPANPASFTAAVDCLANEATNVSFAWTWNGGIVPERAELRNAITGTTVLSLNSSQAGALSCPGCTGISSDDGFGMYYIVAVNGAVPSEMAGAPSEIKTVACDAKTISSTTIYGTIFDDSKSSGTTGVFDSGEKGIIGAIVTLVDPGPDGVFDVADDIVTPGPDGNIGTADDVIDPGPDGVINKNDDITRMKITNKDGKFTFTRLTVPTGRTTQQYKITSFASGWVQTLPDPSEKTTAQLANNSTVTGFDFGWKTP